jgi:hypothetical protein
MSCTRPSTPSRRIPPPPQPRASSTTAPLSTPAPSPRSHTPSHVYPRIRWDRSSQRASRTVIAARNLDPMRLNDPRELPCACARTAPAAAAQRRDGRCRRGGLIVGFRATPSRFQSREYGGIEYGGLPVHGASSLAEYALDAPAWQYPLVIERQNFCGHQVSRS